MPDEEAWDEAETYLGGNPAQSPDRIHLREVAANKFGTWIKTDIDKKEEKENLLAIIPRKSQLYLEALGLNEEIAIGLHPRALVRDNHFKKSSRRWFGCSVVRAKHDFNRLFNRF